MRASDSTAGVGMFLVLASQALGCGDDSGAAADVGPGSDGGGGSLINTVSGTITLPEDATDRCIMVAVDDDTTGSNSSARRPDGTYLLSYQAVSGTSVDFSIDRVPDGTYFVWGYVDTDGSASEPSGGCEITDAPNTGDYLGYYDTGLGPPGAANVEVPHAAGVSYDFSLGLFP